MRLQKTMMGLSACTSCIVYSERGYYSIKFLLLSSFLQYPILSLSSAELYFMVSRISGMPTAYVRTPSFFPMSCQWCKSPWWFPSTLQSWWVLNAMFGLDTLADSRIALTWLMITSNTMNKWDSSIDNVRFPLLFNNVWFAFIFRLFQDLLLQSIKLLLICYVIYEQIINLYTFFIY